MTLTATQAKAICEAHDISLVDGDEETELLFANNPELAGAYQALLGIAGLRPNLDSLLSNCHAATYQDEVHDWLISCFGPEIASDRVERNHRFIEEALELVQALGCTKEDVLMLVDYVFNRPLGDPPQEVGGVSVTLAALCQANGLDQEDCANTELDRIWHMVDTIREKQKNKPKGSALSQ